MSTHRPATQAQHVQQLAAFIASHGMTIRRVTPAGVLAASAGTTREGYPFSDLSPLLCTFRAARDWLGY